VESREIGLQILYNRVKDNRSALGIKTFKRTPTAPVKADNLLCVFMLEGEDQVIKPSTRSAAGYPAQRVVEIVFEIIALGSFDIRAFYTQFRNIVLSEVVLAPDCFIRETGTNGPRGYGQPNVIGMQLILSMNYIDKG